MATRKASIEDDESPRKRRRLDVDAVSVDTASFDALNSDCIVQILSFISVEDMNSLAICSHRFREARRNDSLDQTRTGTIVCSEANHSTVTSLCNALNAASNALTVNRMRLKIVGLEQLDDDSFFTGRPNPLVHVTSLELSLNPNERSESTRINGNSLWELPQILPNLRELTLNGVSFVPNRYDLNLFCRKLPNLIRVTWKGGMPQLKGDEFRSAANSNLAELFLDDCQFVYSNFSTDPYQFVRRGALRLFCEDFDIPGINDFILRHCEKLERLSMKGATWSISSSDRAVIEPIPQEMLMKMARNIPMLRWLRSDLSEENVAILQQERPEVTFVTE